jgi:hypothetical protein
MATVPEDDKQDETAPVQGPPAPSPYSISESLRKPRIAEEAGLLRTTFLESREIQPDRAKRVLTLLGKTGIDPDVLNENLEEAEFEASKPNFNPEEFRTRSPIMSRWLQQSPHHMRLVHDDLEAGKLNNLEKVFARQDDKDRVLSDVEREELTERMAVQIAQKRALGETARARQEGLPSAQFEESEERFRLADMTPEERKQYFEDKIKAIQPTAEDRKQARAQIDENEEFVQTSGPQSGLDAGYYKRMFKKNPLFLLPFLGTMGEMPEHIRLFQAAKALKAGNETQDDRDFLITYGRLADAAERRGTDIWGKTADVIAGSVPFAAEFALTGPAYGTAKKAALTYIRSAVRDVVAKYARGAVRGLVGSVVGSAARTVAGVPRLIDGSIQKMTQAYDVRPDEQGHLQAVLSPTKPDDALTAITKTFGEQYIENLSELAGVPLEKTLGWAKARIFKGWMDTHPQGTVAKFVQLAEKGLGWNGILGEMFEERVGEFMRAGVGLEDYKAPTGEQLLTEFMAFALPGIPGHAARAMDSLRHAHGEAVAREEGEKAISAVLAQLGVTQTAPDLAAQMIEEISKSSNQGTEREFKYIDPGKVKAYYEQKGVDPEAKMAELGVAELYRQGLANHHDVQVPMAKYDAYVATGEDATFWQKEAVNAPGQETVTETEQRIKRLEEEEKARAEAAKAATQTPEEAAQAEQKKTFETGAGRVREVIANALKEAGRPAKEIRIGSTVAERVFRVAGERMGMDPWELFRQHNLTIGNRADVDFSEGEKVTSLSQPPAPEYLPYDKNLRLKPVDVGGLFPVEQSKLWEAGQEYYSKNLQGKTVENPSIGQIVFSGLGRRKSMSLSGGRVEPVRISVVKALMELAKMAVPVAKADDVHARAAIAGYLYAVAPVRVEGKNYAVKMILREITDRPGAPSFYNFEGYELQPAGEEGLRASTSQSQPEGATGVQPTQVSVGPSATPEGPVEGTAPTPGFSVEQLLDSVKQNRRLFQPTGGKGNRGRITIGNASIDIALLKDADFSTFLHEFAGHFYLEVLKDLAAREGAPREVLEDWQAVLNWLGVKDASEITDEHHEKFAEGVERYFWEGKAPSTALRRVFWHCKVMLTRIYKAFIPGADLNDQMRRVFDRMLATEEEIADAAAEYGNPLYNVLLNAGMDPDRAAKLAKATLDAQIARDDRLRVKALRDLHREERADFKANRARIRAEVAAQVNERQDVKLLANLQTGLSPDGSPLPPGVLPVKLWDKALEEGDYVQAAALPPGVTAKRSEGAEHPDAVAYTHGFQNAAEMINALVQIGDKDIFIERLTDERMIDQYGPPMSEQEIRLAAEEAVHSEEKETQLRLELEELIEKDLAAYKAGVRTFASKPRIPDSAAIHRQAAKDIGKFTVRQIRPAMFKAAEVKAARASLEAALKGDWGTAADQHLIQYLNFARYQAATKAREFLKKSLDLVRDISKTDKKLAKSRNMDLVNAARSVLANYEIGRFDKQPGIYLDQLKRYEPAMYEALEPQIAAALVDAKDYRDVPFSQFESMMETVKGFWDLSIDSKKMEVAGEKVEIEMVGTELGEDLVRMGQPHEKAGYRRNLTTWEDTVLWLLSAKAQLRRVESWADAMGAKFTKFIWRPIVEATDVYRVKRIQAIAKLYAAAKAMGQLKRGKIEAPEISYTFDSEGEMIMALLHSGNESNLRKLLLGREWGREDEGKNLDISTWERFRSRAMQKGIIKKEHYDFVQAVWNIMEDLKPAAQLAHKSMHGRFFAEITRDPIQTIWGVYDGGYFPAKTDPRFVSKQAVNLEKENTESFNNSYAWPTTGRGATIERVQGYNRQLSLNFNLIPQHIDWALRFSYIEPRVREVSRLLNDHSLKEAIDALDPKVRDEMLVPWLQRAAQQRVEDGPKGPFDSWWRFVRRSAGVQIMALNLPNALQNLTGVVVAGVKVEPRHLRNALFTYMGDPAKYAESIRERSSMMKARTDDSAMQMMADIREIVLDPSTFSKLQNATQKHAYALQRLTQNAVDNVVWGAAYEQAVEGGVAEKEAVQQANAAVRLTQGSTNAEDIARYEVGSPFYRVFVQFTSFFNMKANLMATEFAKEIRTSGLKNGAGRMLYLYAMGHAIPAMMAAVIFKAMSGGWDDDDDDGYLDELMATMFGSQVKEMLAMVPGVGQGVNTMIGGFTPAQYDDRVNLSPAIQAIERAVTAPGEIYRAALEGKGVKKATKDALSMLGLFSGIPTSPIARPIGYLMDVESGTAEPSNPFDYARGLVTGKPGPKK